MAKGNYSPLAGRTYKLGEVSPSLLHPMALPLQNCFGKNNSPHDPRRFVRFDRTHLQPPGDRGYPTPRVFPVREDGAYFPPSFSRTAKWARTPILARERRIAAISRSC